MRLTIVPAAARAVLFGEKSRRVSYTNSAEVTRDFGALSRMGHLVFVGRRAPKKEDNLQCLKRA